MTTLGTPNQDERPVTYLSPSNFAFLHDECPCCYYNEVHGLKRPRAPFPSIFNRIDAAMKAHLVTGPIRVEGADQAFSIISSDKRVSSAPQDYGPDGLRVAVRGIYDSLVRFEDGTLGIVDEKTAAVKPQLVTQYARQLHSYKRAIEDPAKGEPLEIGRLGLLVWEPAEFKYDADRGTGYMGGRLAWLDVPVDDAQFDAFLGGVSRMLALPEPPPPDGKCGYCAYRMSALTEMQVRLQALPDVTAAPGPGLRLG